MPSEDLQEAKPGKTSSSPERTVPHGLICCINSKKITDFMLAYVRTMPNQNKA